MNNKEDNLAEISIDVEAQMIAAKNKDWEKFKAI